jgi:hypothetical protein
MHGRRSGNYLPRVTRNHMDEDEDPLTNIYADVHGWEKAEFHSGTLNCF